MLRQQFADAEQRFAQKLGVELRTHFIHVLSMPQPVRVIETGSGPTVFMLHGGPAFAGVWLPLMAKLHGMRLVAVDRPGYGLTGFFDYRSVGYRDFAVSFLDEVLTELGLEQVPVIASSMGGLWTLWLALEHPDRISSMVQLGCPPFVLQPKVPLPFRLLATRGLNRFMLSFERPSPEQMRKVFTGMGHAKEVMNSWPPEFWDMSLTFEQLPEYQRGWLAELERVGGGGGGGGGLKGPQPGMVLREDDLTQVRQPTLFIWGQQDKFDPPDIGHKAARAIASAEIVVVYGGHVPWLDAPGICGEHIAAFLRNAKAKTKVFGAGFAERSSRS